MSVLTSIPTDGFLGSTHNNVATAAFPKGTKITVKQDAATGVTPGYCTFIYWDFNDGTGNVAGTNKVYVSLDADATGFKFTSDQSDAATIGLLSGISIGGGTDGTTDPTDNRYIWVQVGGPICNGNATAIGVGVLDGNYTTSNAVAAGSFCYHSADNTIAPTTSGTTSNTALGFILSFAADTSTTIDAEYLFLIDKFPGSL